MPSNTHRGRRVRRATSWELRSWSQAGNRSLTQGERETFFETAERMLASGEDGSEDINDLPRVVPVV